MDTFQADPPENQEFQVALQAENAQLHADGLAMRQQVVQAGLQLVPFVLSIVGKKGLNDGTTRSADHTHDNSR